MSTSDGEKATTIWLSKPQDGAEAHGARAKAVAITTGKAIPYAIALKDDKMVCTRSAAKSGHRQCHMQR